jgi:hypothetical protein
MTSAAASVDDAVAAEPNGPAAAIVQKETTMATDRPLRAALYARVSTTDQTTENQVMELRRYAEARGWTVADYIDNGISGTKERRPALDRLMADARRRRFDVLIVWRLDRLGRDLSVEIDAEILYACAGYPASVPAPAPRSGCVRRSPRARRDEAPGGRVGAAPRGSAADALRRSGSGGAHGEVHTDGIEGEHHAAGFGRVHEAGIDQGMDVTVNSFHVAGDPAGDVAISEWPLTGHRLEHFPALGGEHLPEQFWRGKADPGSVFLAAERVERAACHLVP